MEGMSVTEYKDAEWNQLSAVVKEFNKEAEAVMWSGRLQFTDKLSREFEGRYMAICSALDRLSNNINKDTPIRMEAMRVWKELYDKHGLGKAPYGG
jgi:hypothetical protein